MNLIDSLLSHVLEWPIDIGSGPLNEVPLIVSDHLLSVVKRLVVLVVLVQKATEERLVDVCVGEPDGLAFLILEELDGLVVLLHEACGVAASFDLFFRLISECPLQMGKGLEELWVFFEFLLHELACCQRLGPEEPRCNSKHFNKFKT